MRGVPGQVKNKKSYNYSNALTLNLSTRILTNSYLAQQEGAATNKFATWTESVSVLVQQSLSSYGGELCGAVGRLKVVYKEKLAPR